MTLLRIGNQPMRYAWGNSELLADLLGVPTPEYPIAEQWFGTHPTAPSEVLDSSADTLLERRGELGYLVKFLSSAMPLSIQAHPNREQAQRQFAAGHKSYSDANHKPEIIIAITEFRALCGFRPKSELAQELKMLAEASPQFTELSESFDAAGYEAAIRWIYEADEPPILALVANANVLGRKRARLVEQLFQQFGEDRGILVSVLMNLVSLEPNEALYLPAGNIHAYLSGLGVEVMAASDNVLRGGLTQKPIDVRELTKILDYRELAEPKILARQMAQGLWHYPSPVEDFQVYRVEPSVNHLLVDLELNGSAIAVCTQGEIILSTSQEEALTLKRGQAAFMADSNYFSVSGSGTGFLALG